MRFINRLSKLVNVLLAILLPFAMHAVIHLPIGSAGVHEWLPKGRVERQRYEEFLKQFGSDQILMISWEDAKLSDPRVQSFVATLENDSDFSKYFNSVVSPNQVLESLQSPPLSLSRQAAIARLQGTLVGNQEKIGIAIFVNDAGVNDHNASIAYVRRIADQSIGVRGDDLKLVGTVFESYAIDQAAESSLTTLVVPSTIIGLLISWMCVRSLRAMIVVMLLAMMGQLLAISVVYYGGYQFSAVMIVLPTLIFVLTLAGAIHLVNYLYKVRREDPEATGVHAVMKGWWPCFLSSATTMLGMGSSVFSQLAPVWDFDSMSAVCLGISTVALLLAFPALADLVIGNKALRPPSSSTPDGGDKSSKALINRFLNWQYRRANAICFVSIVLLCVTFLGLANLNASTKFVDMFPPYHKTYQDMLWFEENVSLVSNIEVLVKFAQNENRDVLQESTQVLELKKQLEESSEIGGTFSAVVFFPKMSAATGIRATAVRAVQRRALESSLDQFQSRGLLFQTEDAATWRISCRVSALSNTSYGTLTELIRNRAESAARDMKLKCTIEVTGLVPVLHETQLAILSDLGYSFISAYLMITPVMIFVTRSFFGGLLIMLPNVLPIAVVFGMMGWTGTLLDIAGILTASIALGIAVDETLHFTCWYIDKLKEGLDKRAAVASAFNACVQAMIQTTLISSISMVPFLFASFTPTEQFAKLMIAILVAAMIGDLILLPALLLSPMGNVIRVRGASKPKS